MAESLSEFVHRTSGQSEPGYDPEPWYNVAGDCMECNFRPDEFYACRVDSVLTLYRSIKTEEIVGFQVKAARAIHEILGDFCVEYRDKQMTLGILILGAFYQGRGARMPDSARRGLYDDLRGRLGRVAETEVCIP